MHISVAQGRNHVADILYPIVVRPLSEEDGGGYLAAAPDLQGCVGDGDTPEEAIADLRRAIEEWRDEASRLNRKVPKPEAALRRAAKEKKELLSLVKARNELIEAQQEIVQSAQLEVDEIKRRLDFLEAPDDCGVDEVAGWSRQSLTLLASNVRVSKRRKLDDLAH
jgi:antitoxin HicB